LARSSKSGIITGTKMFAGTIDEVTESSLVTGIPTLTHSLN
jgi:hypothetical protein